MVDGGKGRLTKRLDMLLCDVVDQSVGLIQQVLPYSGEVY